MEVNKQNDMPVQRLYALTEKSNFSIEKLNNAGMMKKAELAQVVISDLHEINKLQNVLINSLVHEVLNLKQRAGL
ncbi:MAG: hypothetical protein V4605_08820 [Pseudomonadota bacterium]